MIYTTLLVLPLALNPVALANGSEVTQSFRFDETNLEPEFELRLAGDINGCTLKGVRIELELTGSGGGIAFDNDGDTPATITVTAGASAVVSSDDIVVPSFFVNISGTTTFTLAPDDEHPGGPPIFTADGGPDFAEPDALGGINDAEAIPLAPPFLPQFAGTGTATLNVSVDTALDIDGGGAVAFETRALDLDGVLRVTYVYACVLCESDLDRDGDVDLGDFGMFGAEFGRADCSDETPCAGDFDGDGDVDLGDFGLFGLQFADPACVQP